MRYQWLAILLSFGLANCATSQIAAYDNLVEVPAIMASLKCAFALALVKEAQKGVLNALKDA
jgi:hypothetical protein